jgi:dinuclear metal center YbgI/SA1388 family protein
MPDRPTIHKITAALENWAPPGSAQDYDNVGLQVGDASREVETALLALDMTPDVLEEADAAGADLVITHHPLLFRPLRGVTADGYVSRLALRLAERGIALYSIHTNLDAARDGVSFALGERLGLENVDFLTAEDDALYKLVTFVPTDDFAEVHEALAEAGAGRIGDYEACAYAIDGTGYFRPGAGTDPHIGTAGGDLETVAERRIEMEVPRWNLGTVLGALDEAHPYEEVAYDVYPVDQPATQAGLGAIGRLPEAEPLSAFLDRVSGRLDAPTLRYAGDPDATVERVAVCGGAGSDLVGDAQAQGADAFVTADVTYHEFFEVLGADGRAEMAFVDAGHYETEALTEALLRDWLAERFSGVTFRRTETHTSPMRHYSADA